MTKSESLNTYSKCLNIWNNTGAAKLYLKCSGLMFNVIFNGNESVQATGCD